MCSAPPAAIVAVDLPDGLADRTGCCIATRASCVTSRALETWPGASRPSGSDEVRVASARARRAFAFISATNAATSPRADVRARARLAASFALWISAASTQLAHGDPLAGAQVDRRLADRGRRAGRPSTTSSSVGVLERDEHGHQLRDRRDRQARVARAAREHLAGRARSRRDTRFAATAGAAARGRERRRRSAAATAGERARTRRRLIARGSAAPTEERRSARRPG